MIGAWRWRASTTGAGRSGRRATSSRPAARARRLLLLHGFPETHRCWEASRRRSLATTPSWRPTCAGTAPRARRPAARTARATTSARWRRSWSRSWPPAATSASRSSGTTAARASPSAWRWTIPERVTRLAVLNVVPTVDQFERMGGGPSLGYWPWFLLAQAAPFPERMVGARPGRPARARLRRPGRAAPRRSPPSGAPPTWRRSRPDTIAAMCGDYRASFHLDREHDADDRAAGRRDRRAHARRHRRGRDASSPTRPTSGAAGPTTSRRRSVPGGHFVPEEAPDELAACLADFLRP